jgi:hypothetical protein
VLADVLAAPRAGRGPADRRCGAAPAATGWRQLQDEERDRPEDRAEDRPDERVPAPLDGAIRAGRAERDQPEDERDEQERVDVRDLG